jgi:Ser/Thr protein kinase RdoA (MazF antagonist)
MLGRHLADRYGVTVDGVREVEPGGGVFHVAGPDWVVRVFPPHRPVSSAEHDARVLAVLEAADVPAERLATDEPVSVLEDGRAALATRFAPGRQCRDVTEPDLLEKVADVLGRVHALPMPEELRPGGGWHLASAATGTRADDVAALLPRITDDRLRDAVEAIDTGDGLPASLVHPDPSGANVIADPGADPVLIDWTGAGRGPRLLSLAVLLGAALEEPELAALILRAHGRHVDLVDEELARLPGVLCDFPLLVGTWLHATYRAPAAPILEQHHRRQQAAERLVAGLLR